MHSELYWVDTCGKARLAIMARPRAGDWLEDEIAHWVRSGVEIVVSLLERDEVIDLGLEREVELCRDSGIEFLSFPIPDRTAPADVQQAMRFAAQVADREKVVAVHCRAGIGRSSVMAAAILAAVGVRPDLALAVIEEARGLPIPDTDAQRQWVLDLPVV